MLTIGALFFSTTASAVTFGTGDIFASTGNGTVQVYDPTGVLLDTLNTGLGGFTTGSVSNTSTGNFYVTDFSANTVSVFSNTGASLGTFGSGYSTPESILFDGSGNVWTGGPGYAGGANQGKILEFNSAGTPLNQYAVAPQNTFGPDWIDLASNQTTFDYTSEGTSILRYDTGTGQLANLVNGLPGSNAYALRILGDGSVLVADTSEVVRVSAAGAIIQTYSGPWNTGGLLFALNLDPDGTSFWTGDSNSGDLFKINIATGALEETISTGAGGNLFGVSVYGEITQASTPEPGQLGTSLALIGLLAFLGYRRSKLNAKAAAKA